MSFYCQRYRAALMEFARVATSDSPTPATLESHLMKCARCTRFLEAQFELTAALQSLSAATAMQPAPAALEARTLAAVKAPNRPPRRTWIPAAAGTLAACGMIAAVLARRPAPPKPAEQPFIEIPYVAPLAPYERAEIVRMEMPVAALIAVGFEIHAPDAGAAVTADVLVGQDGRAHAIRLISNSIPVPNRSIKQ